MNKTVSINLGGFFFHIDEDAFQKLNRYFDAIRRSLSADGRDEIMSDIEARIAELLSEKLKNEKQVVSNREVDEVIAVMGQPEDYRIDDEEKEPAGKTSSNFNFNFNYTKTKKFYRDEEAGMVGGVCAGLAHYFKIDPLWVRVIFIASLLLSFGTSMFIYLLLLVLIPRAITTTEKLEMTGEPINISNIERKVKEEFSHLSDKLNNVDYDKLGATVKNSAERIGNGASTAILAILKAIAKVIGAILTVFSALILGGFVITLIVMLFTSTMTNTSWYPYFNSMNYTNLPMWLLSIIGFFAIAIPLFSLFLLGLKILVDNLKPVGNLTKYTLLAIWLVCVSAAIYLGLLQSTQFGNEGKIVSKQQIKLAEGNELQIKFKYNEYFTKSINHDYDFSFKQDSLGNDVIYSNDVRFYVLKTDEAQPYVQIEKIADGASISEARKSAETIKYGFKIEGNNLILDNYLLTGTDTKYHRQRVEIFLYLPEGTVIHPDESLKDYDDTDNEFFDLWFDGDHSYMMEGNRVQCLDCIATEENGYADGNTPEIPEAPAPVAPANGSENGRTAQETIRIMELEAERAKMEQERMKLEREIEKERIKNNKQ